MEPLNVRRGDIYMAYLAPAAGSAQGEVRPVLIIRSSTGDQIRPDTTAAVITAGHGGRPLPQAVPGQVCGLPEGSSLSAGQLRSLDRGCLLKYLGHLDKDQMHEVSRALKADLSLLRNEPHRITLCPVCASAFYESGAHVIRRAERYQAVKSVCNYCRTRYGFDYFLTDRKKRHPAEECGCDESVGSPSQ